ncbi:MAG: hypothetical protein Q8R83_03000 [Legionellaceae bacterium]|nr:hypothetical protein [Legionellaceae bacterium]
MTVNKSADNIAKSDALTTAGSNLKIVQYVQERENQIRRRLGTDGVSDAASDAISDTVSMATYIAEKRTELLSKLWDGTITEEELLMLKPGYFTFQETMAQKALQELDVNVREEKLNNVSMIYNVNDKSEFIRGYLRNNKQLNANDDDDKKIINILDKSFHSWLLNNGMTSVNGVIYTTDKLDKKGAPINKANPKEVSTLIVDPVKGLAKKQEKSFSLEVKQYQGKKAPQKAAEAAPSESSTPSQSGGGASAGG